MCERGGQMCEKGLRGEGLRDTASWLPLDMQVSSRNPAPGSITYFLLSFVSVHFQLREPKAIVIISSRMQNETSPVSKQAGNPAKLQAAQAEFCSG